MHVMQLCWGGYSLVGPPLGVAGGLDVHRGMLPCMRPLQHDVKGELDMITLVALSHIDTCMPQPHALRNWFSTRNCMVIRKSDK